jgi:septal ring factor EnvC (AmiA/AmiB activator)
MKRAALVTLTILLFGAGGALILRPAAWAQDSVQPTAAEARRSLASARNEAMRARERAALLDRQARASLIASDKARLTAAALAARVQQAEAALAASQADLVLIGEARQALDVRLARESAPVARLLAALQTQVRRTPILQLLQPGSIADSVHVRAVVVAVEPQIRSRTAKLRSELSRARSLERDGARATVQFRTQQADLVARRGELAALSAAERLKARRAASAADREAERAYISGASARDLSTLVRRLEAAPKHSRARGRSTSSALAASDLTAPHRLPVQGRLAAAQSASGKGLTLEPRPGALVVAPGPGRVAFAGPYRGFGTIVILEHAGGWSTLLTGLAAAQVAVGQMVVAGSPLGQAPVRDPSISVELRRGGISVDPTTRLR